MAAAAAAAAQTYHSVRLVRVNANAPNGRDALLHTVPMDAAEVADCRAIGDAALLFALRVQRIGYDAATQTYPHEGRNKSNATMVNFVSAAGNAPLRAKIAAAYGTTPTQLSPAQVGDGLETMFAWASMSTHGVSFGAEKAAVGAIVLKQYVTWLP